jgi:hypothetical protein
MLSMLQKLRNVYYKCCHRVTIAAPHYKTENVLSEIDLNRFASLLEHEVKDGMFKAWSENHPSKELPNFRVLFYNDFEKWYTKTKF